MSGVVARSATLTVLGGGFLIGKAILNILAPEGGSVYRRSLVGYFLGGIFVLIGQIQRGLCVRQPLIDVFRDP